MTGIRADANSIIASGHVMRCITIARQIVALGESVTFFVADNESLSLVNEFGADISNMEIVVLGSDWQDLEGEIPLLKKELSERKIKTLLVDSYKVTKNYFRELSKVCEVAYMDDLGKEAYPVDVLINYCGYYDMIGYEKLYEGVKNREGNPVKMLLGLMYAPLREQFYGAALSEEQVSKDSGSYEAASGFREKESRGGASHNLNILLTAGGADMHGMLIGVLDELEKRGIVTDTKSAVTVHVVIGSLVRNADEIRAFADKHSCVYIYEKVKNMAELMRSCDLAIAAAGTMLTECAAILLPVIFYQVADNQKYNVKFWQRCGGMVFAGDVSSGKDRERQMVISNICDKIRDVDSDSTSLATMKRALSGITDGRGAKRIATAMLGNTHAQETVFK
jgi:UDP-2,4-diacetamido-2,4,6-trideoxy-beta-L-altropyranose hydrolase